MSYRKGGYVWGRGISISGSTRERSGDGCYASHIVIRNHITDEKLCLTISVLTITGIRVFGSKPCELAGLIGRSFEFRTEIGVSGRWKDFKEDSQSSESVARKMTHCSVPTREDSEKNRRRILAIPPDPSDSTVQQTSTESLSQRDRFIRFGHRVSGFKRVELSNPVCGITIRHKKFQKPRDFQFFVRFSPSYLSFLSGLIPRKHEQFSQTLPQFLSSVVSQSCFETYSMENRKGMLRRKNEPLFIFVSSMGFIVREYGLYEKALNK